MMGHKERMKGGDEYDCFTSWRDACYPPKRGGWHRIKKMFSRRVRRSIRRKLKDDYEGSGYDDVL